MTLSVTRRQSERSLCVTNFSYVATFRDTDRQTKSFRIVHFLVDHPVVGGHSLCASWKVFHSSMMVSYPGGAWLELGPQEKDTQKISFCPRRDPEIQGDHPIKGGGHNGNTRIGKPKGQKRFWILTPQRNQVRARTSEAGGLGNAETLTEDQATVKTPRIDSAAWQMNMGVFPPKLKDLAI